MSGSVSAPAPNKPFKAVDIFIACFLCCAAFCDADTRGYPYRHVEPGRNSTYRPSSSCRGGRYSLVFVRWFANEPIPIERQIWTGGDTLGLQQVRRACIEDAVEFPQGCVLRTARSGW